MTDLDWRRVGIDTYRIGSTVLFLTPLGFVVAHVSWDGLSVDAERRRAREEKAVQLEKRGLELLGWKGKGGR